MERHTNAETAVRETILAKAQELAELIASSSEVQFYKKAEKQISANEHIQSLIRSIKKKQKEATALEARGKSPETVEKIEGELAVLQDELDHIPLVTEFQQSQHDINDVLQLVVKVIRDSVSDTIEVEAGRRESSGSCD